jgi:serine/threonine-protein kinase
VEKIDRYQMISELGRGGMATVYKAHDPLFARDVAVKILPREFLHDPLFRQRFEREARTIAALEHHAIVPVYDVGESNGQPFLVMRYMPGGSLAEKIRAGALPRNEVLEIMDRIGSAVDYAHKKGVIHRDLKPANILFDNNGQAYLSDFGIAKISQAQSGLTGDNLIGTPAYMSPEQVTGIAELDGRSDIYALGAILFEALTGTTPFSAPTPIALALKQVQEPVPNVRALNASLPESYNNVVQKAMAKNRDDRFATGSALSVALRQTVSASRPLMDASADDATLIEPLAFATTSQARPTSTAHHPSNPAISQPAMASMSASGQAKGHVDPYTPTRKGIPVWVWAVAGFLLLCVVGVLGIGGLGAMRAVNNANSTSTAEAIALVEAATQQAISATEAAIEAQATATAKAEIRKATEAAFATEVLATQQAINNRMATRQAEATAQAQVLTSDLELARVWDAVVADDFSDSSNPNDWYTGEDSGEYANINRYIRGGVLVWQVESIQGVNSKDYPGSIDGVEGDFYLRVDMDVTTDDGSNTGAGLMLRRSDADNFVIWLVGAEGYWISIMRDGEWQDNLIDFVESSAVNTSGVNTLEVLYQGGTYRLFINGENVNEIYFDEWSSGNIGITVDLGSGLNATYRFDNFELRQQ